MFGQLGLVFVLSVPEGLDVVVESRFEFTFKLSIINKKQNILYMKIDNVSERKLVSDNNA